MRIRTGQYSLVVFFVIHLAVVNLYGQETKLIHFRTEEKVLLRWAPSTSVRWLEAIKSGITLERYTIIRDSTRVFPPEIKVVATSIKPLELEDWEEACLSNRYAALAAQALYGETFLIDIDQGESEPIKAIQMARDQDARFSYLLLACEQDFSVAKMAGLGFEDISISPDESYLYKIYNSSGYEASDTAFVFVAAQESPPLPGINDLAAEFNENQVELKWSIDHLVGHYTSYQIERSLNGDDYVLADSVHSILTDALSNSTNKFISTVNLPGKNQEYFFRVKGVNSFGLTGPASNVISGFSKQKLDIEARLSELSITDSLVRLQLRISSSIESTQLQLVKIILNRSADSKIYTKVKEFEGNAVELTDFQPISAAYYQAILLDEDANEFKTLPILVQLKDSIPPLTPRNFRAYCDSVGLVHLSWESNQEADLGGYRVYRSRVEDAEYRQITSSSITKNSFIDSVGLGSPTTKIFYKLQAEDRRYNRSNLSTPISMQTRDNIPPVPPRIYNFEVLDSGTRIDWIPSSSNDVTHTVLLRKTEVSTDTLTIANDNSKSRLSFMDTTSYAGVVRYSFMAIDRFGNYSERSNIIQINVRGQIPDLFDVETEINRKEGFIKLSWQDLEDDYLVRIYASVVGKPLRLIDELQNKSSFVRDIGILNSSYEYKLVFIDYKKQKVIESKNIEIEL